MPEDVAELLFALERRLHQPELRADAVGLDDLLAPEFREFGSSGRVWSREEIVAALAAESGERLETEGYECLLLSPETALVTYTSSKVVSGQGAGRALRSSLWRFRESKWQIVFHQGTPLLEPT